MVVVQFPIKRRAPALTIDRFPALRKPPAKILVTTIGDELKEVAEGGEVSMDDVLASQMGSRAQDAGITFVAFTATPKTKTMELFGTRPDNIFLVKMNYWLNP